MGNIANARPSPRIVNGVLMWYEGDTFNIDFEFEITDQDCEPIDISPTDVVKVKFIDATETLVKEFTFTEIENNTITLEFDSDCTALFPKGKYKFDVYYTSADRTTVVNDSWAEVE